MPAYTYSPAAVLIEETGDFAIGATGVLRPTTAGDPALIYDLNGSPITSIVVGPKGAHQAFMADISHGVLDFGSVLLPAISMEQHAAAFTVVEDAATALSTAEEALAVALDTGKYVIHGSNPDADRPATDAGVAVVWFGSVDPLNMIDGLDLWVNPSGGITSVTIANMPAGFVVFMVQNSDGTWPNRRTSRTDLLGIWVRIVAGSSDPAAATSPAVNGAYGSDIVVGA